MNKHFKNKVAWVTGSSRGIGRCIAEPILDHNLISTMLCCRAVVPDMRGPGGAYISGQVIRVDGGEQLSPC